jgi:hypothetical protein
MVKKEKEVVNEEEVEEKQEEERRWKRWFAYEGWKYKISHNHHSLVKSWIVLIISKSFKKSISSLLILCLININSFQKSSSPCYMLPEASRKFIKRTKLINKNTHCKLS